ncbi:hypothetical protein Tco_1408905 [Tanacetum coccineum]
MKGIIDEDDELSNEGWRRWDNFENTNHDHAEREYEMEHEDEVRYEEYVAIKEHEYDDLTGTNEDACHTYQEIFRRMDEGWMVTRAE